jgi:hypothetical protein
MEILSVLTAKIWLACKDILFWIFIIPVLILVTVWVIISFPFTKDYTD